MDSEEMLITAGVVSSELSVQEMNTHHTGFYINKYILTK
jgi:hypothetical protein